MSTMKSLFAIAVSTLFVISAIGQNISTVAGSWNIPDRNATTVSIFEPVSLATDSSGNLYLDDLYQIYKLDSAGNLTLVAGNGMGGDTGDGGPATSAGIQPPGEIAVDIFGNIYIADPGDNVIRKVDATTGIISTIAGNGTAGYTGDGGPATSAELNNPSGVAVDSYGNIFVADSNNDVIRKVDTSGTITTLNITQCSDPSGGAFGINTLPIAPNSITADRTGNLYVSDFTSVVVIIDPYSLTCALTAGTFGASGYAGDGGVATSAELNHPSSVALDSDGNLYIADYGNNVVREVNASTGDISTVAGTGTAGFTANSGVATSVELYDPTSVAVDNSNNLYIADSRNYAVREIAYGGDILSTAAGNGYWSYSGDGDLATSAQMADPQGAAVDSSGNIYIADSYNSVIRKVDAVTGDISTVAGNGAYGYSGDGGSATSAELADPMGVAIDSSGNIYIADSDDNVIRKVDAATGDISTIAGDGSCGYTGDGGSSTNAELCYPTDVAADNSGHLFIADWNNNAIREVNVSTGDISTVAGNGTMGYTGDGGPATDAELNSPNGVATDSSGNLFIADTVNLAIREVILNPSDTNNFGNITTVAGGTANSTSTSSALGFSFSMPTGVYVDNSGTIFVSDEGLNQVYRISGSSFLSPGSGVISLVAGNGSAGYPGDGGPAISAELYEPFSIAGDSHGNLLIADADDNLIRSVAGIVTIAQVATPTFSPSANSYAGTQSVGIADTTPNSTIYYTTDGTTPTTSSIAYEGTITVSSTETIEAIAVANGYFNSPVATATYTIVSPNPMPVISALSPAYADQGGTAFSLTVDGTGYVPGSTVYWGSNAVTTTYVSATQLTASIPANDIASTGTATITVQSPTPGGGTSTSLSFEIDTADGSAYSPTLTTLTATVTAGSVATYSVTLPSSASDVSVTCLNLPADATCSYSAGALTIDTSAATPTGTYQITVVFNETITTTSSAWIFIPILLLPLIIVRKKLVTRGVWMNVCLGIAVLASTMAALGCGGGSGSSSATTTQTEQVKSSASVALTVK